MSDFIFKYKPNKPKAITEIATLNTTHKHFVDKFSFQYNQLDEIKKQKTNLESEFEKCQNVSNITFDCIQQKNALRRKIATIDEKIYEIENKVAEVDYYTKTGDIILDYYDEHSAFKSCDGKTTIDKKSTTKCLEKYNKNIVEESNGNNGNDDNNNNPADFSKTQLANIDSFFKNKKNINAKKNTKKHFKEQNKGFQQRTIFDYFNNIIDDLPNQTIHNTNKTNNANDIIDAINSENIVEPSNLIIGNTDEQQNANAIDVKSLTKTTNTTKKNKATMFDDFVKALNLSYSNKLVSTNILHCNECDVDKTIMYSDGIFVCPKCGEFEQFVIESDIPNYKDQLQEKQSCPYKRINHFLEWLSQFQAKESTEIPANILADINAELKKYRIAIDEINIKIMKKILKKLRLHSYYEHIPNIIGKITGKPPPFINRETEEILKNMFKKIQIPFARHCPPDRVNFLSYSYTLYKFCELIELDEFLEHFTLLKSRDKLLAQDKIWEKMCGDLKWQFIPSI